MKRLEDDQTENKWIAFTEEEENPELERDLQVFRKGDLWLGFMTDHDTRTTYERLFVVVEKFEEIQIDVFFFDNSTCDRLDFDLLSDTDQRFKLISSNFIDTQTQLETLETLGWSI